MIDYKSVYARACLDVVAKGRFRNLPRVETPSRSLQPVTLPTELSVPVRRYWNS